MRYDNLTSAVKKILRGQRREESERFIGFRSHWRFESEFCNPARGNEKGGVESEQGYFRRNHLVPLPEARDLAQFNAQLLDNRKRYGRQIEALFDQRPQMLPFDGHSGANGLAMARDHAPLWLPLSFPAPVAWSKSWSIRLPCRCRTRLPPGGAVWPAMNDALAGNREC